MWNITQHGPNYVHKIIFRLSHIHTSFFVTQRKTSFYCSLLIKVANSLCNFQCNPHCISFLPALDNNNCWTIWLKARVMLRDVWTWRNRLWMMPMQFQLTSSKLTLWIRWRRSPLARNDTRTTKWGWGWVVHRLIKLKKTKHYETPHFRPTCLCSRWKSQRCGEDIAILSGLEMN